MLQLKTIYLERQKDSANTLQDYFILIMSTLDYIKYFRYICLQCDFSFLLTSFALLPPSLSLTHCIMQLVILVNY